MKDGASNETTASKKDGAGANETTASKGASNETTALEKDGSGASNETTIATATKTLVSIDKEGGVSHAMLLAMEKRISEMFARRFDDLSEQLKTTNVTLNDNSEKLDTVIKEVAGIKKRVEEIEGRVERLERGAELSAEVALACIEVLAAVQQKNTDLESRSRRNNLRISGIPEQYGAGKGDDSMPVWLDGFLKEKLGIEKSFDLKIQRAHRTLAPKPTAKAPPRAVIVLFLEHTTKEMVRKEAWRKKPTMGGIQIYFDDDYPADVANKRMEYNAVKRALATNNISYNTPGTTLKVHFGGEVGTKIYSTAQEATLDLRSKGYTVDDPKPPRGGRRTGGSHIQKKIQSLMDWQEEGGRWNVDQNEGAQLEERRKRIRELQWNLAPY